MRKKIFLLICLLLAPTMVFAENENTDIPNLTCVYYSRGKGNTYPVMLVQTNKDGVLNQVIQYPRSQEIRNSMFAAPNSQDKSWAVIKEAKLNVEGTQKVKNGTWLNECPEYAIFDEAGIYNDGENFSYKEGGTSVQTYKPQLTLFDSEQMLTYTCKDSKSVQDCIDKTTKSESVTWGLKYLIKDLSYYRPGDEYDKTSSESLKNDPNAISCDYDYNDELKITIMYNDKIMDIFDRVNLNSGVTYAPMFVREEFDQAYKQHGNKCPDSSWVFSKINITTKPGNFDPYDPANIPDDNNKDYINNEASCNGVLGETMTKVVNNIFTTIQFLGPVLVIVLSIVDFAKAALSGESGDMKKAYEKLIKRLICAVLLFFVPLLCKLIFSITGITMPETCIK